MDLPDIDGGDGDIYGDDTLSYSTHGWDFSCLQNRKSTSRYSLLIELKASNKLQIQPQAFIS